MVKQNDKLNYTAQGYANAETVGVVEDTTVFVPQMIVGEEAIVKVNYAKRNVAYADVVQLLKRSAKRKQPSCHYFGKCGGCALMHMRYTEQLAFKRNKVAQNLKKIGAIDVDVLPCIASDKVLGYRNKLSLPVRGRAGNVKIGMFQRASHIVVDMDNCILGDWWSKTLVQLFREYLNSRKIVPYNEKTFAGQVRHIVGRYVDGQLLVTVVSNGKWREDLAPFVEALKQSFPRFGLFVNENTSKNNVILGNKTRHVYGLKYIEGRHLGVRFRLRPDSFFQVNDNVKDKIYQKTRELLDTSRTEVLVDCFSGIGILTNILASDSYPTYAIELEKSAVKDAEEMKLLNGNANITNICGDVNVELPKVMQANAGKRVSMVVDPPRKGLGESVCDTVLHSQIDNIVYISCDSATLARDLKLLCTAYDVSYLQPFDMFPNTAEVETVVLLTRKN